jgi:hypothetical protein
VSQAQARAPATLRSRMHGRTHFLLADEFTAESIDRALRSRKGWPCEVAVKDWSSMPADKQRRCVPTCDAAGTLPTPPIVDSQGAIAITCGPLRATTPEPSQ